ncbi:hypothetical protein PHMEG_00020818 [Phytophthora megakarya]|uniref:Uncharacterized protein n=1 Tax=Phytophthora megakarya TaxID=4795 RepID=A0A225VMV6_9STRA|nr:hypothetical protein PHMEG_00020818 [Phytophthora megakarya]
MRCKLLMANLAPAMLRMDIHRLAAATHRHVKQDDVALYKLIVKQASMQQHYHQIQHDVKKLDPEKLKNGSSESESKDGGTKHCTKTNLPSNEGLSSPPSTGCRMCKGSHWMKDCPTATEVQKAAARKTFIEKRKETLNVNIISKTLADELLGLGAQVKLRKLSPAGKVQVAGGAQVLCRNAVTLDLWIETAAEPVNLRKSLGLSISPRGRWYYPNFVVVVQNIKGSYAFGLFDLFKGFWLLPLHPSS